MERDELTRRTWRYWYEDGIAETLSGLGALLATGLSLWTNKEITFPGAWAIALGGLLAGALLGLNYLMRWGIRRYKEHVTYPRTGYVSYRRSTALSSPVRWVAFGFFVLAGLAGSLGGDENLAWVLLIAGVALWGEHLAATLGLARFHVLAAYTLLAGELVRVVPKLAAWGLPAFVGLVGLGYVVSGVSTLIVYLRRHPGQDFVEEERE